MVQSSWALLLLWFAFAYCPYTCDSSPIPIGISGLRIYVPVSVVTFFVIAFSIVASITYFFEALVKQDVYKEYTLPIRLPHNLRILSGFFGLQYHRPVGTLRQRGVRQVLAMSEMTPIDRSDD